MYILPGAPHYCWTWGQKKLIVYSEFSHNGAACITEWWREDLQPREPWVKHFHWELVDIKVGQLIAAPTFWKFTEWCDLTWLWTFTEFCTRAGNYSRTFTLLGRDTTQVVISRPATAPDLYRCTDNIQGLCPDDCGGCAGMQKGLLKTREVTWQQSCRGEMVDLIKPWNKSFYWLISALSHKTHQYRKKYFFSL